MVGKKLENLVLETHPDVKAPKPGDFCTEVKDGKLLVPQKLLDVYSYTNLHGAFGLYSNIEAFPSVIASAFRWTYDEIDVATEKLRSQLAEHLPYDLSDRSPPPKRSHGANPPYPQPKPTKLIEKKEILSAQKAFHKQHKTEVSKLGYHFSTGYGLARECRDVSDLEYAIYALIFVAQPISDGEMDRIKKILPEKYFWKGKEIPILVEQRELAVPA